MYDIETEYRSNPIGLDIQKPGFSWKLKSSHHDVVQISYRILVSAEKEIVWDSGEVNSSRSLYVIYGGKELLKQTTYNFIITVHDNKGESCSAKGEFETGLLSYENFAADWITDPDEEEACGVFMKEFHETKEIIKARAYVSALGLYEMKLNGKRVGDARFAPGWTSYQSRLQYQTYDITEYVCETNQIHITVGNGWYKGVLGFYGQGNHYGTKTALIAMVDLFYKDGTTKRICTDASWQCTTAEHRYSEIYHGEIIDFSIGEQPIKPVSMYPYPKNILTAQENEAVKITERIPARSLLITPKGEKVIDFGQNMAGVVELQIKKPKGTKIVIKHGEALDENGDFYTTNLRTAKATDVFITSGGYDVFMPMFTYHGFRYICIEGMNEIDITNFTACVMHTDLKQTGTFSCANEDINKLVKNIDWTMRSNYFDIPTDCPQRDERLGYTGDTEIFLPTACFHKNVALFFRKWLRDLKVEQSKGFGVPLTVPDIIKTNTCVQIWHEAATIVPWTIWQVYGDDRILKEQYESMKASVAFTKNLAGAYGLLQNENSAQFGDWVALDAPKGPFRQVPEGIMNPPMEERGGGTDSHLIANVYYLYAIDIMAKTAKVLGYEDDTKEYQKLYEEVLTKFRKEYITENGRLVSETQTACALVLYFNLAKEEDRSNILNRLILNLVQNQKHLRTGFVGTEYLGKVLSQNGQHQMAGDILMKEDCPSWLYGIRLGATTIWELWDGVNPDGSFNQFEMNSLNQFGFASVGDWIYQEICGLQNLEAGYKKSLIKPRPIRGIPSFHGAIDTVYGKLSCDFSCKNGWIDAHIIVPVNTKAVINLPDRATVTVGSGEYHYHYQTKLSYEKQKFTEDTTLNELLSYAEAEQIFMEEAPELAASGFVRGFAGELSIIKIEKTLPKTLMPEKAYPIFRKMIDTLNKIELYS
jgi:alpha-L-rhamnosidase